MYVRRYEREVVRGREIAELAKVGGAGGSAVRGNNREFLVVSTSGAVTWSTRAGANFRKARITPPRRERRRRGMPTPRPDADTNRTAGQEKHRPRETALPA